MNSYLAPKMSSFCVANLRNSWLLRAIRALNLNILNHNLLRSEWIRRSISLEHQARDAIAWRTSFPSQVAESLLIHAFNRVAAVQ
jgi:hypothetical protein